MSIRPLLAAALLSTAAGCASNQPKPVSGNPVTVLPASASVFVRASFDSDGTSLIGSFIPDDVEDGRIDESQSQRTRCSEYIKVRSVQAGGEVEELFGASMAVGGKLGVPMIAQLQGETSNMSALRIKYAPLEKLVADVDAAGLRECCAVQPDQCSRRYIASAIRADGQIYAATESATGAGGEGNGTFKGVPITGDAFYKDGLKWERTTQFKGQYFAFTLGRVATPVAQGPDDCSWARSVPKSLDGQYFVGVSDPMPSEKGARDFAMRSAREQVIKYIGEWLEQQSSTNQRISGAVGALQAELEDSTSVATLSQGVARLVKDERWCAPEDVATANGTYQVMRVLAFFPKDQVKAATRAQLTSLMDLLRSKKKLNKDTQASLEAALSELQ